MEYSYRFRIYPTKEQEAQIAKTLGCCRYVYNHYLAMRTQIYKDKKESMNYNACSKDMTELKKSLEWLKEVDSTALQSALKFLDTAYQNFFRRLKKGEKPGYPRFKRKHDSRQSYTSKCAGKNIQVLEHAVKLPKLGKVKCRISKQVQGRILSATVSRNPSGKYFVSLCCTDISIDALPSNGKSIGIDLGIKAFAVSSDGFTYQNHKYLASNQKKLAKLQRQLSRKTKGSKRRDKAKQKVAQLHERIANQRKDMLHQLSTKLIRENDIICMEDLAVRKWTCPDCSTVHDRDVNAAKNILAEGLRMLA